MTGDAKTPETTTVRPLRHKWQHHDDYNSTCTRCGTRAQKRPSPYERRWFTEWRLPDGTSVNNYGGGRTPPCQPAQGAESVAGGAR